MDAVVRAAVIYVFLLVLFRVTGRRTLAQITTFDFVLLLIIAEATQQGLLGNDFSITNALLVILALLLGLDLLSQGLSRRWRSFDRWINGLPLVLVEDGRLIDDRARKAGFLEDDILEQARANQGIEGMEQIKYAVLERDGSISVIPKSG